MPKLLFLSLYFGLLSCVQKHILRRPATLKAELSVFFTLSNSHKNVILERVFDDAWDFHLQTKTKHRI